MGNRILSHTKSFALKYREILDVITESVHVPLVIVDNDGLLIYCNKPAELIYEKSGNELIGSFFLNGDWLIADVNGNYTSDSIHELFHEHGNFGLYIQHTESVLLYSVEVTQRILDDEVLFVLIFKEQEHHLIKWFIANRWLERKHGDADFALSVYDFHDGKYSCLKSFQSSIIDGCIKRTKSEMFDLLCDDSQKNLLEDIFKKMDSSLVVVISNNDETTYLRTTFSNYLIKSGTRIYSLFLNNSVLSLGIKEINKFFGFFRQEESNLQCCFVLRKNSTPHSWNILETIEVIPGNLSNGMLPDVNCRSIDVLDYNHHYDLSTIDGSKLSKRDILFMGYHLNVEEFFIPLKSFIGEKVLMVLGLKVVTHNSSDASVMNKARYEIDWEHHVKNVVFQVNEFGEVQYISKLISSFTGKLSQNYFGSQLSALVEADKKVWFEVQLSSLIKGLAGSFDFTIKTISGKDRWLRCSLLSANLNGQEHIYCGELSDVGFQYMDWNRLVWQEERYKQMSKYSMDAVVVINDRGIITEWSAKQEELTGFLRSELIGKYIWEYPAMIFPPEVKNNEEYHTFFRGIKEDTDQGKYSVNNKRSGIYRIDGVYNRVFTHYYIMGVQNEWSLMIVNSLETSILWPDGTEKLKDTLELGLVRLDAKGNIVEWDEKVMQLTGIDMKHLIDLSVFQLQGRIVSEDNDSGLFFTDMKKYYDENSDYSVFKNSYNMGFCVEGESSKVLEFVVFPFHLQQQQDGLGIFIRDVNVHLKTIDKLKNDVFSARAASKSKSMFLASMSHEIRTPLNAVLGFTDVLLESEVDNERKRMLSIVKNAGSTLLELINDILDLSKIESGKIIIEKQPFNLKELVEQIVQNFQLAVKKKKIYLKINDEKLQVNQFVGDAMRIRQIVYNLVNNAIKFTDIGGVEIILEQKEILDETVVVQLSVSDTGIGIPEHSKASVFEAFHQVSENQQGRQKGAGLGLSIVREIVNLMDGEITLESTPGKGSSFICTLPFKIADKKLEQERKQENQYSNLLSALNLKVLLVDQHDESQELSRLYFNQIQADLDVVNNGRELLVKMAIDKYDLVIADIHSVNIPCEKFMGVLRENDQKQHQHTMIMAVTSSAMSSIKEKCMNAGMDAYLTKPLSKESLYRTLFQLFINKSELLHE